jgi:ApaG protein
MSSPASPPPADTHAAFSCSVKVQYLDEQSEPSQGVYAYGYTVTIQNTGNVTAQLIARQWLITDAHGHTEEVRGLAVVGHQPLLQPGQTFEYSSWTRLGTPQGTMRGTFFCMTEDARPFEAPVETFLLAQPQSLH